MLLQGEKFVEKCDDENNSCKRLNIEDFMNAYIQQNNVYCINYDE